MPRIHFNYYYLFLAIFLLALFLYTVGLDNLPYAMHGDEAETALQALTVLQGKTGIIGTGWYDLPLLSFIPHALGMLFFDQTILGDRMGSVLFGLATLPFFYLLVLQLFSKRIAILATLFLATSHMFIALSRIGVTYVQAAFFTIATFYFVIKGIKQGKMRDFIIGGIFLGFCFYSYFGARIAPFIILPYFLATAFLKKYLKKSFSQLIILLVSAAIIFAPQGFFFLNHPFAFSSRTESVYLFSQVNADWLHNEYPGQSNLEIVFSQMKKTVNIFAGDVSGQYGYKGQLLDYATLILILLGIVYILKYFQLSSIFLLSWFLSTLFIGQVLTTAPAPLFVPRFVIGLPVLFIFCALGIELLFELAPWYKNFTTFVIIAVVSSIILFNLWVYFIDYPKQLDLGRAGDPNALAATKIAGYLNGLPDSYVAVFLTQPSLYADFGTLRFLSPQRQKIKIDNPQNYVVANEPEGIATGDVVYVLYPQYRDKLEQLQAFYPKGQSLEFENSRGEPRVYFYRVGF